MTPPSPSTQPSPLPTIPQSPHTSMQLSTPQSPLTPQSSLPPSPALQSHHHINQSVYTGDDPLKSPAPTLLEVRMIDHSDTEFGDEDIGALLFEETTANYLDNSHEDSATNSSTGMPINLSTLSGHKGKVNCCDFSYDGRFFASGGQDKAVLTWDTSQLAMPAIIREGHTLHVMDVRFAPSSPFLASGSLDKSIRVWKVWDPEMSPDASCVLTLSGLAGGVCSVDFHPAKVDTLCSVDHDGELRFWNLHNSNCTNNIRQIVTKTARFQPGTGRLLAAGSDNLVKLFDSQNLSMTRSFPGHNKPVHSVTWGGQHGSILASGSEDSVIVWDINASKYSKIFKSDGNKIHCCQFHPTLPNTIIIGTYQKMFLWDFESERSVVVPAHTGIVSSLAMSYSAGLFASASHDSQIKLWK